MPFCPPSPTFPSAHSLSNSIKPALIINNLKVLSSEMDGSGSFHKSLLKDEEGI
jgi:hypothetical protein